MIVRVFDNQRNTYFKSEVFAIINSGWYEKRLVVVPHDNSSYFKFFECIDKSIAGEHRLLINTVTGEFNPNIEWIYQETGDVDKKLDAYAKLIEDDIRFFEYNGCSWIYENKSLLAKLLNGGTISTANYKHQITTANTCYLEGWHYVSNLQDIDFILEQTNGFHDSVFKEMSYSSGSYVDSENNMYGMDNVRQVTMRFDSQWCRSIEMVFEGVVSMNLRPHSDNESAELWAASLFIQNETVFFFDSEIDGIDNSYDGTWISAYGLRWRFYGENRDFSFLEQFTNS